MVSAYGGSNPIQWKTTEYPIPKVRLEHHGFYVLNIIGITSCESEFYFFAVFPPLCIFPNYFRTTLTRTLTCFLSVKVEEGRKTLFFYTFNRG